MPVPVPHPDLPPDLPAAREPGRYRIALVCLGNICRSPTAHVVLESRLADNDANLFTVPTAAIRSPTRSAAAMTCPTQASWLPMSPAICLPSAIMWTWSGPSACRHSHCHASAWVPWERDGCRRAMRLKEWRRQHLAWKEAC